MENKESNAYPKVGTLTSPGEYKSFVILSAQSKIY